MSIVFVDLYSRTSVSSRSSRCRRCCWRCFSRSRHRRCHLLLLST